MKLNSLTFYRNGKYVYYSFYAEDARAGGSTGIVLSEGETLQKLNRANKNLKNSLEAAIDKYVGECELAVVPTSKSEVEKIIKEYLGKKPKTKGLTLLELAKKYHEAAKTGEILTRNKTKYSDSSLRLQRVLIKKLEMDKIGAILLTKFNINDFRGFVKRLSNSDKYDKKDLGKSAKNSTATYTNQLAYVLSGSLKEGWHNNNLSVTNELTDKGEVIDYAIYYSIDELEKFYNHGFSGHDEQLRDVFIFGCFTCLRHSDYYRANYKDAVIGNELILELKKKKNRVSIPLHPIAKDILEKYDYSIPRIGMYDFNRNIKELAKEAGFIQRTLFTRTEGGVRISKYKEKWELTSSHTMRRSFATNALKSGLKEWVVMSIGGWKSEAAFKKYKRMSEQDVMDNALASDFYRVRL